MAFLNTSDYPRGFDVKEDKRGKYRRNNRDCPGCKKAFTGGELRS